MQPHHIGLAVVFTVAIIICLILDLIEAGFFNGRRKKKTNHVLRTREGRESDLSGGASRSESSPTHRWKNRPNRE